MNHQNWFHAGRIQRVATLRWILPITLIIAALFLFGSAQISKALGKNSDSSWETQSWGQEIIVLGFYYPGESIPAEFAQAAVDFAILLKQATGLDIEVFTNTEENSLVDRLGMGQMDIATLSSLGFVNGKCQPAVLTHPVPVEKQLMFF